MPKYERIANIIRKRIQSGEYPKNTLIPNQTDFVEEFQVSRMTIKKAIDTLVMEGLLYSKRGVGTMVLENTFLKKTTSLANEYSGLTETLKGQNIKTEVLVFDVMFPTENIREKLKIDAEHPVYEIQRLRYLDDEALILEHTYMPTDLVPKLTQEIISESIYDYLKKIKLEFAGAHRAIKADKPSELDQKYLDCLPTDPVLEVEQVVYLQNSRVIEYSTSRNRYDKKYYSVLDVIQ